MNAITPVERLFLSYKLVSRMLYQLTTTVNEVKFMALVCTHYSDLENPQLYDLAKTLCNDFWKLENKLLDLHLKGERARFSYCWPTIGVGFKPLEAARIFTDWEMERRYVYYEEQVGLIESAEDRVNSPDGRNIFEGLKPIRRSSLHPLLVVRV